MMSRVQYGWEGWGYEGLPAHPADQLLEDDDADIGEQVVEVGTYTCRN